MNTLIHELTDLVNDSINEITILRRERDLQHLRAVDIAGSDDVLRDLKARFSVIKHEISELGENNDRQIEQ